MRGSGEVGVLKDFKFLVIDFIVHLRPENCFASCILGFDLPFGQPDSDRSLHSSGLTKQTAFYGQDGLSSPIGISVQIL